MRIFERLPGRTHAAPPQRKRYDGIFASRPARASGAEIPPEPAPIAVQDEDCLYHAAATKAQQG